MYEFVFFPNNLFQSIIPDFHGWEINSEAEENKNIIDQNKHEHSPSRYVQGDFETSQL